MSKQPKLTPWFLPEIKPVRVGVYERVAPSGLVVYSLWDSGYWHSYCTEFARATLKTLAVMLLCAIALAALTGCASTQEHCGTTPEGDGYCLIFKD